MQKLKEYNRRYYNKKKEDVKNIEGTEQIAKTTSTKIKMERKKVTTTRSQTRTLLVDERNKLISMKRLAGMWKNRYRRSRRKISKTQDLTLTK